MKENKKTKTNKVSMDDLAIMIGRGFEDVNNRFGELDSRLSRKIDSLDNKIDAVEEKLLRRIDGLSNRIDDLSLNRATREELKILSIRVEKVEKKVFSTEGGASLGGKVKF